MVLTKLELKNFTTFEKLSLDFSPGINVFVGENATGKTHIMKVAYAACQAAREDVSFSHKLVKVFRPDSSNIGRLVHRSRGVSESEVVVCGNKCRISATFSNKAKKWDAEVKGEAKWEECNAGLVSTFVPAKEILSNSYLFPEAYHKDIIDFDETYMDIIASAKLNVSRGPDNENKRKYLRMLSEVLVGTVTIKDDRFYLKPGTQALIEFQLVAEGMRKLALLWQLVKNGTLEKGTVLFWDEPEANLNPKCIPFLVEMLLELQRDGVQCFIATHDYVLAKYFDLRSRSTDPLKFFSLYHADKRHSCETSPKFDGLINNPIKQAFDSLLDEVLVRAKVQQ